MIYWHIFSAFFIANILGYGGGPATIPLVQREVVNRYGWMNTEEFGEVLALGNALPGPIATKMAGYIGFEQAGLLGAVVALFATVAPSLMIMIAFLQILHRFKDSPKVQRMSLWIRPTIAILLGWMAYDFFYSAYTDIGWVHTLVLLIMSFYLLERKKVHPAFVIVGALGYGAVFLGG
ncbi:chromate transporter [Novibacillus thermophilus]|jgi:chromate transporter|uniref:Transporter n=1 Tax=Novibacillus thermophilus TaxID=1471761 RepID=A0A1U9K5L3_9BACL|nr:chromate transporter [Novibacillus thermophilus]AQS55337.1 transporter [Novibacillus thermophilus]